MLSVGIVTRTKNRNVLLKRALESVINQTYTNWHLVVVNDGGDIESVNKLIAFFQEKWQERITVIHNPESVGMASACNLGLERLNTDLAVIHDDDDSWSPDFLLRTIQTYKEKKKEFPNLGGVACHCNQVLENIEGNIIHINHVENFNHWLNEGLIWLSQVLRYTPILTIGFIFELNTCKQIQGLDKSLPVLSDWDFHVRFIMEKDIYLLPETLAFYHHRTQGNNSLINSNVNHSNQYALYRTYIENKWLREDLKLGKQGIGTMVTLLSTLDNMKYK